MKKSILAAVTAGLSIAFLSTIICCCSTGSSSGDSEPEAVPVQDKTVIKNTTIKIPENKSQNAKNLMQYIADVWESERTLSGQQDLTWDDSYKQFEKVVEDTGRYPAIAGFDFMNYTQTSGGSGHKQTEEALAWWNGTYSYSSKANPPVTQRSVHGIVTFCWHWRNPLNPNKKEGNDDNFYTKGTSFRIPYSKEKNSLNTDSNEFAEMKKDMDTIAQELLKLKEAGCPVLWRPLHEASGGWFWWGTDKDAYIALYKYMYDYFTNEKKLDNLIWVWNAEDTAWYPGDDYVDIVAADCYNPSELDKKYNMLISAPKEEGSKIAALSENGYIPQKPYGKKNWAYFVTWNDNPYSTKDSFWSNDTINPPALKKSIYGNTEVFTLDELPDLTAYHR